MAWLCIFKKSLQHSNQGVNVPKSVYSDTNCMYSKYITCYCCVMWTFSCRCKSSSSSTRDEGQCQIGGWSISILWWVLGVPSGSKRLYGGWLLGTAGCWEEYTYVLSGRQPSWWGQQVSCCSKERMFHMILFLTWIISIISSIYIIAMNIFMISAVFIWVVIGCLCFVLLFFFRGWREIIWWISWILFMKDISCLCIS